MTPGSFCRSAVAATALVALLLGYLPASASEEIAVPLSADDECAAAADGEAPAACGLSALQLRAAQQQEKQEEAQEHEMQVVLEDADNSSQKAFNKELDTNDPDDDEDDDDEGCKGLPGCGVIKAFNKEFDTNDPNTMQKAMNEYTEWKTAEEGIKVCVTKTHYYEMYHGNVASKLAMYMPQGLFGWKFGDHYELVKKHNGKAVIARSGTVTFNMGWWRRNMFWKMCVKPLPKGKHFDFSSAKDFDDCKACPAKMEYTLMRGGLDGKGRKWKITDLKLIKMT